MKKNLLFLLIFLSAIAYGQAPNQINYQGIARNSVGNVLPGKNISVRLSVHDGNSTGTTVYSEIRNVTTSNFGLFNIAIGSTGAVSVTGTIGGINWSSGAKFLQVEIDPAGGSNFLDLGAAQLLSVPYALFSGNATSGLPTGSAGGDLSGSYPNPSVNKIQGISVLNTAPTNGQVLKYNGTQWVPGIDNVGSGGSPTGPAGGDLSGTYPNPTIATNAVTTTKIADASVTSAKLAAGVIPTSLPPNGTAGGDLSGTYPNPTIATNAVTTTKIADASVTSAKLAAGVIPTSLPPNGTAGGDLSGTYPNPSVNKIQGISVINTAPANGQVLKFNGTQWVPGIDNVGSGGSPTGPAGGDLSGTYPDPTIATNAVTTTKLADNSVTTTKILDATVTSAKLAAGVIPTSLPPNGTATGDLSGSYPGPIVSKIQTVSVSNIIPATGQVLKFDGIQWAPGTDNGGSGSTPTGPAGGDLNGAYPNPNIAVGAVTQNKIADDAVTNKKIKDDAVTTTKILDASVTSAKLAAGVIPTSLPPNGTAGGDLSGTYPNPGVNKIQGITVNTTGATVGQVLKFDGIQWGPGTDNGGSGGNPTGPAGGDLSGTYPNPTITTNAITTTKLADNSVTTLKITDASVTLAKLAAGVIPTSLPPSGTAGGDLTGTYPNPTIAANAVTTAKILDASVTSAKLAAGVIPTSLPPNGTAGGDLSGTYPNPSVNKIQGVAVNNTAPTNGQVLKYNGTQWIPSVDNTGSITLPYSSSASSASNLFSITNTGSGAALEGINSTTTANVSGIIGKITSASPGAMSAGVIGINNGTGTNGIGVYGTHLGNGQGVYGNSAGGTGVYGNSTNGFGLFGTSINGTGIFAQSTNGNAASFNISNTSNSNDAVFINNSGQGNGIFVSSDNNNGIMGITNSNASSGIMGFNNSGGIGIWGVTLGGTGAGIKGTNTTDGGTAVEGELQGVSTGNLAVFKVDGTNVARINQAGKGFFNGGTQTGGADVAEFFDVEGNRNIYEPGDVLIISQSSDRKVEKSQTPYSTLVAGVFATKPGLLLTEKNAEQDQFGKMVPMGIIGVIPTKVSLEGGNIKRGDLLVTSSTPGVAMKADVDKVKVGQVIGKALQDYTNNGIGKINVLVSIK